MIRTRVVDGGSSSAPHIPFMGFRLFQEDGQTGIVVTSNVRVSAGPMDDETAESCPARRCRLEDVEDYIWLLVQSSRYGVVSEFWGRLRDTLAGWESLPLQEEGDRFRHLIEVGRGDFWAKLTQPATVE